MAKKNWPICTLWPRAYKNGKTAAGTPLICLAQSPSINTRPTTQEKRHFAIFLD